jgi:hypothetical protein
MRRKQRSLWLSERTSALIMLWLALTGCSVVEHHEHYDAALHEQMIQAAIASAVDCERGYVRAHLAAQASASEIADAAIEACEAEISAATETHVSDMAARYASVGSYLGDSDAARERALTRAQTVSALRGEALRLVVDGRTPANR